MLLKFKTGLNISQVEQQKFSRSVYKFILRELYEKLRTAKDEIQAGIRQKISEYIQASPEVNAMIYGQLRYDLGILPEEAEAVAIKIPAIIAESMKIYLALNQNGISLNIQMITEDWSEILNISEGTFIQTFTRKSPYEVPWLEWLLTKGNEMIIGEYSIKYYDTLASRTGHATMIRTGWGWRISPQYSGTPTQNFITRALENIEDYIYSITEKYWR